MKRSFILLFLIFTVSAHAQQLSFGRSMVDTLTAPHFWGRGYTNNGMAKAADFLAAQFELYGLKPMGKNFLQTFSFPVNSFPGKMEVEVNGTELVPGKDFLISPESKGLKGKASLQQHDSVVYIDREKMLIVKMEDKLTWSVAQEQADYTVLLLNKGSVKNAPSTVDINVENRFIPQFKAANVCAMVKGTVHPDSFLIITAHYDHLGGMGSETYFPGANDNASGVSLLMNLAQYYARNPQPYSIGFILFAAEEAGLVGSKYFTENPLIDLKKIRFLLNTDLAGTGEEGITVVNASEHPTEFGWMQNISSENKLLAAVNPRGKAANSDHYWFSEKGVPAFFFYTLGGIKAYHDVFDRAETLPLATHENLFQLIKKFNEKLMGK